MNAMPERVQAYITPEGDVVLTEPQGDHRGIVLVPESRLLAAEARVREVEAERNYLIARLAMAPAYRSEITDLRAERDALVPLARLGERALLASRDGHGMDGGDIQDRAVQCGVVRPVPVDPTWDCQVQGACDCDPEGYCYRDTTATTHARAILAREAGA